MKTTAFILGIMGLFTFVSCKCNLEEDESEKKPETEEHNRKFEKSESDTLHIQ